ncbi:transcriptional regulator of sugar metabolism, DeoR family [Escherichia fergusonii]|nr:transcriptional regulator of sugar metabolism, DeoR family [Escherichia fergusonii]
MTQMSQDHSLNLFLAETLPGDSRQARQLARRQLIVEAVMAEGAIRIEEITERYGISLMTAHRDIDELAERGLLHKSRGVVSATSTSLVESSDLYRATRQLEEKQAIAEVAVTYLEPGQAIFLDDSTTVFQMARYLPARTPLTVITNSLTLMNELKNIRDLTLLGLGGAVPQLVQCVYGAYDTRRNCRPAGEYLFCQYVGNYGRYGISSVSRNRRNETGDV